MSSQADVHAAVDRVASKGLAYALGLYIYFELMGRPRATLLSQAFGMDVASSVLGEIEATVGELLKGGRLEADDYQRMANYVYRKYVAATLAQEAGRRLASASEEDRKISPPPP